MTTLPKSTPQLPTATPNNTSTKSPRKSVNKVAHDIVKAVKTDPTLAANTHIDNANHNDPANTQQTNAKTKIVDLSTLDSGLAKGSSDNMPPLPLKELVKQYDSVSLLLQGGGALGAYQAGIYEGLLNQGITIDRISGISIAIYPKIAWLPYKAFGKLSPSVTTRPRALISTAKPPRTLKKWAKLTRLATLCRGSLKMAF